MGQCEMCGKEAELYVVIIEGTELKVCKPDAKFGKVIRAAYTLRSEKKEEKPKQPEKEIVILFDPEFPKMIKEKREALGLTQEELGKKINEKASIIHQLESGHMQPSVELASKIERLLKMKIIQEYQEKHIVGQGKPKSDTLTLGDLVKLKMK